MGWNADWILDGTAAQINPPNNFNSDDGSQVTPVSPTCPVALAPATLSFSSPGTYTHQFLGQVNSGPPASSNVTLTALSNSPAITVSNLIYVPNDTTNPAQSQNPNSVYGDVTVTNGAPTSAGLFLYLNLNSVTVATTLDPIALGSFTPSSAGCPTNITPNVQGTVSPAVSLFGTQIWTQVVKFKNTSGQVIAGPIVLALNNLSANARLFTASGTGPARLITERPTST